jgi:hypothetical protein
MRRRVPERDVEMRIRWRGYHEEDIAIDTGKRRISEAL